jgi:hypothetical protein
VHTHRGVGELQGRNTGRRVAKGVAALFRLRLAAEQINLLLEAECGQQGVDPGLGGCVRRLKVRVP